MEIILLLSFAAIPVFLLLSGTESVQEAGEDSVILVGHRGTRSRADENTIKAFGLAADYGMDIIECDPRLTKDGAFIIMHDKTVDRTTNGSGKVEDMTLDEIRMLRTEHGEMIPTLEEVLDVAKERRVRVYLDTGVHDISTMEKLMAVVVGKKMRDRVVAGLWRIEDQKWMQSNYPEVTTSLSWPVPALSLKQIRKLGADWVGMLVETATAARIRKAKRLGLRVITMPINSEKRVRKKMKAGLDIIQTDDPLILQFIVEKRTGNNCTKGTGE